jgi:hypothetical protein
MTLWSGPTHQPPDTPVSASGRARARRAALARRCRARAILTTLFEEDSTLGDPFPHLLRGTQHRDPPSSPPPPRWFKRGVAPSLLAFCPLLSPSRARLEHHPHPPRPLDCVGRSERCHRPWKLKPMPSFPPSWSALTSGRPTRATGPPLPSSPAIGVPLPPQNNIKPPPPPPPHHPHNSRVSPRHCLLVRCAALASLGLASSPASHLVRRQARVGCATALPPGTVTAQWACTPMLLAVGQNPSWARLSLQGLGPNGQPVTV